MRMKSVVLIFMVMALASCNRDKREKDESAARQAGRDAYRATREVKREAKEAAEKIRKAGKEAQQGWNEAKREDKAKQTKPPERK